MREVRTDSEIIVRRETPLALIDDFDAQLELAQEMLGRQPGRGMFAAENYVRQFQIVKYDYGRLVASPREKPFKKVSEDYVHLHLMQRSPYDDRMGINAPKRGKYRDEDRIGFNEYGTIEVGECQAVGSV